LRAGITDLANRTLARDKPRRQERAQNSQLKEMMLKELHYLAERRTARQVEQWRVI
jgi:hypothetical protein